MLTKKQIKQIEDFAADVCWEYIYFDYKELDDDDVERIAKKCKVTVEQVCEVLEIDMPELSFYKRKENQK